MKKLIILLFAALAVAIWACEKESFLSSQEEAVTSRGQTPDRLRAFEAAYMMTNLNTMPGGSGIADPVEYEIRGEASFVGRTLSGNSREMHFFASSRHDDAPRARVEGVFISDEGGHELYYEGLCRYTRKGRMEGSYKFIGGTGIFSQASGYFTTEAVPIIRKMYYRVEGSGEITQPGREELLTLMQP